MEKLTLKDLVKEVKNLQGKTLISFHSMGDVDALASAFALREAIKGSEVRRIDSVNSQARKVWAMLDLELDAAGGEDLWQYDNLIFVDVSTPSLLGNLRHAVEKYKGNLFAIDHHSHNQPLHAKIYVDATKTSCAEVVYGILKAMKKKPGKEASKLIAAGIVSDTANMKSATTSSIIALGECLKSSGMELQELYDLLTVREDPSEKIAVIEAVKRARIERIKDIVIAESYVGAYELRCAAALVQLGCDFAVVANQKEGKASAVKGRIPELKKINVGKLMDEVARELKGSGGGHEMVGGSNYVHGLDALIAADKLMAKVREEIG
ncbi:MAG: DHH family phosphoesterase [Candidatus Micrarchaeota archaeon]